MRYFFFLFAFFLLAGRSAFAFNCPTPDGLTATADSNGIYTLGWNAVSGAQYYSIEIEDEQNNPSTYHLDTVASNTSLLIGGLQAGVQYKFKVRAHCGGGSKSDWSDWKFFTGGNNGGGNNGGGACGVPTGLNVTVANGSATLNWNAVSGAVKYYLEVEDEQNNPSNFHLVDSTLTTSYTLNGLQAGVLYKFKVRTRCDSTQSDWSAWLAFTNAGNGGGNGGGGNGGGNNATCTRPMGIQVTQITATSAVLSWNPVPGVVSYTFEVEKHAKNPAQAWEIKVTTTDTFYLLTTLQPNTRYKFKVRSNCTDSTHSAWPKQYRFKTLSSLISDAVAEEREETFEEIVAETTIEVWPNPATEQFNIRTGDGQPTEIVLYNANGARLLQAAVPAGETYTLPVAQMPAGFYFLQAKQGDNVEVKKLLVTK